ncbi:Lsr2 family protein [Zafaria cholistanensis]|uniref:Lsr2 family protein n=1 Tax=Zafaria cholistanensis TaxID=1682741 RepID=A0A5A7NN60_9MICC|nr:Lsr2 family protein [Zafaria cholistanensis]GER22230.1 Lsr2 family protein [Zafaria cholistanensis]
MAKSLIIVDDIDGTAGAKSYTFALGDDKYTIDLSPENYRGLQDALAPYIKAATKESGKAPRTEGGARRGPVELQKIREWAASQGLEVAPKGRIKQSVVDAYMEANN